MTTFVINIDDQAYLAGITAAREAYNMALPQTVGETGMGNPELLDSDEAYVQFVMSRAAESYANQYKA